jgi:hypothetical protein
MSVEWTGNSKESGPRSAESTGNSEGGVPTGAEGLGGSSSGSERVPVEAERETLGSEPAAIAHGRSNFATRNSLACRIWVPIELISPSRSGRGSFDHPQETARGTPWTRSSGRPQSLLPGFRRFAGGCCGSIGTILTVVALGSALATTIGRMTGAGPFGFMRQNPMVWVGLIQASLLMTISLSSRLYLHWRYSSRWARWEWSESPLRSTWSGSV